MAALKGPLRIGLSDAVALPGDDRDVDLAASGAPSFTQLGAGTVAVRSTADAPGGDDRRDGTNGRDGPGRPAARAHVATLAASRDGRRRVEVVVDGWRFEVEVEDAARADLRRRATRTADATTISGPAEIRAVIPGRVAAVRVTAGDVVDTGGTLLVVEAMKMQNELRAPRPGTVERVAVGEGENIETGDLLVVLR